MLFFLIWSINDSQPRIKAGNNLLSPSILYKGATPQKSTEVDESHVSDMY